MSDFTKEAFKRTEHKLVGHLQPEPAYEYGWRKGYREGILKACEMLRCFSRMTRPESPAEREWAITAEQLAEAIEAQL